MALSKTPTSSMSDQASEAIASALRTLEAEASGVTALAAALQAEHRRDAVAALFEQRWPEIPLPDE